MLLRSCSRLDKRIVRSSKLATNSLFRSDLSSCGTYRPQFHLLNSHLSMNRKKRMRFALKIKVCEMMRGVGCQSRNAFEIHLLHSVEKVEHEIFDDTGPCLYHHRTDVGSVAASFPLLEKSLKSETIRSRSTFDRCSRICSRTISTRHTA